MDYDNKSSRFVTLIFAIAMCFLLFLMWVIFRPILGAIVFGAIIAGSCYPIFNIVNNQIKIKRELLSIFFCLIISFVIFLPLIFIIFQLSKESFLLYQNMREGLSDQTVNSFLFGDGYFALFLKGVLKFFNFELNIESMKSELFVYIKNISAFIITIINSQVSNLVSFFFNFVVMLLVIYTFFVEGESLKKFIMKLSPLPDVQEEMFLRKFNQMNYVTLMCNGISALIQGLFAGIGFYFANISSLILWSTMMVLLAFIPLLGISIVYIPVCIYLLLKGKILAGMVLFIYCSIIALLVENLFKPHFIGQRIKINSIFILFCIIGGMSVFGVAGIFYGPLIGTFFLTAVDIYHESYAPRNIG